MKFLAFAAALLLSCAASAQTKIAWMGDSITESAPNTGVTKDPPRVLCELLNGQSCTITGEYTNAVAASADATINAGTSPGYGPEYAGALYTVRNLGDSGDQQIADLANRYCRQVVAGETVAGVSGFDYDILVVLNGLNDIRSGAGLPGTLDTVSGESADFIWRGAGANSLSSLIDDACRIQGKRVIMVGITPMLGGISGDIAGKQANRLTVNASMAAAETAGGVVAGTCTGRLTYVNPDPYVDTNADDILDGSVGADGIHPDTATAADLAQAVACDAFGIGC